jgi:probable rRNA maturation factor
MQTIQLINAHKKYRIKTGLLKKKVKHLLVTEGCQHKGVNIIFSDNRLLRSLNKKYRKKHISTDVLAFPFHEADFLGEVYISLEKAKKHVRTVGAAFYPELWHLITHGLLHLLGYAHGSRRQRMSMEEKESRYL